VDISVTQPSFLDRNLAVGADIFYIQRNLTNVSGFSERRGGFSVRAGYEFNERLRQSWSYSLVNRDIYDLQLGVSRFVREQAGATLLSQVSQTLTYDMRDNPLDTRSGYFVRLGVDLAGLGGDVAYVRTRVDSAIFFPLERWLGNPEYVFVLTAGFGYLSNFDSSRPDRIVDRFFLGGENLRGFAIGGASPRDRLSGDVLGGRLLFTQSSELRFPLPLVPSEIGLIGRAFVDVGSLSESDKGPFIGDTGEPRVGAGVGISWRSPFGLINIDIAQALLKQSYDQTQVVRFGFGTRF
jgi:outer membrane protein insertion porin family